VSYLVFCTFDLKRASSQDYQNAYADLARIGLNKVVTGDNKKDVVIPTTAAMGTFNGVSAKQVREDIRDRIQAAFQARRLTSEIFIVVGGDWAWGVGTT
jgi:hypothetical protein